MSKVIALAFLLLAIASCSPGGNPSGTYFNETRHERTGLDLRSDGTAFFARENDIGKSVIRKKGEGTWKVSSGKLIFVGQIESFGGGSSNQTYEFSIEPNGDLIAMTGSDSGRRFVKQN